ncbi:MAG: hypothetical protein RJB38_809 [Pseudomonadota bacterium]|jgi:hypothetical protein
MGLAYRDYRRLVGLLLTVMTVSNFSLTEAGAAETVAWKFWTKEQPKGFRVGPDGTQYYVDPHTPEAQVKSSGTSQPAESASAAAEKPEAQSEEAALPSCDAPDAAPQGPSPAPPGLGELANLGVKISKSCERDSQDCRTTHGHPSCGKRFSCAKDPLPQEKRELFYKWILDAVNEQNERARAEGKLEIHPATVMSLLTAESFGDPILQTRDGGKGLLQFSNSEVSKIAGMDYRASRPRSEKIAFSEAFNRPLRIQKDKNGVETPIYSVWSPKGSIIGIVRKLSLDLNREHWVHPRDAKGASIDNAPPIDAGLLFRGSLVHSSRYLAGYYNRQSRVFNSVEEFYRQTGTLPRDYGQAWSAEREFRSTPALLNQECINRCYVEKIAGLCGNQSQGYLKIYSEDFAREGDRWVRSAAKEASTSHEQGAQ